jgi:hypothetical protein
MQVLLTNAIEAIFIVFVASATADFISGLIRINTPAPKECPPQVYNLVMEESVQVATLPDPWMHDTLADAPRTSAMATPAAISPLPRLLLLPPAKLQESAGLPVPDTEEVAAPAPALPMPELNPPIIQKRKPGRPKNANPAPTPTVAPKRKPGRPKKTA